MASELRAVSEWLEGLPVFAFECDAQGVLTGATSYWTELTGQPTAQAVGTGWWRYLDLERLMADLARHGRSLRRGEPLRHVLRCRDRDGDWRWLRTVSRPVLRAGVLVGLSGLAKLAPPSELTDEEALVRLEQAEDELRRLEALMSAWPDLLFRVTREGVYASYRVSDPRWLYVSPDRFLGRTFEEVLPPDVAHKLRAAHEAALETGAQQAAVYELPVALGLRTFEARVVPTSQGELLYVIRDVTELQRQQEALVHAREDALERNRLKTQFLANVSHEIRTPLNGILGVTQLLQQQPLPPEVSEYIDVLQGAGESLRGLVNDVLDLSRIEANRLTLEPQPFDLEQLVSEATRSFVALAQKKGLTLGVEVAPAARGPVNGDPARIRQIVNNLVSNAVKFTDQGAVHVQVSRAGAEWVRLAVRDTGPGIAPEHHERIFEPFEQADADVQRRFGGTGLGLAITRQLARLMGGDVKVRSHPEQGSTFELELPLPPVLGASPPPQSRVTPPPRRLKVLLAEDDPLNAGMTAALVRKLGHDVEVVHDGGACVAAARAPGIDLVLMDVQMPVLDGLAATAAIRQAEQGSGRHLPIVALTANAMKGDDIRCLSAGMDAYLPKPVTVSALKDLLHWFGSQDR